MTGKQRMLNAYRGLPGDGVAVAPELWYYYPAKLMGLDMVEFSRVPFHLALKRAFAEVGCEGWGIKSVWPPAADAETDTRERWLDDERLERHRVTRTPLGVIESREVLSRTEPAWSTERPVKDVDRDLPAYLAAHLGDPEGVDTRPLVQAWEEVGEAYLLEGLLGVPFFDFVAMGLQGGFAEAIPLFLEEEERLEPARERHLDWMVRLARTLCRKTPLESFYIGCSWSCNSLLGPVLWRRWDKPAIAAVARELHRHGRLLHMHFHGKSRECLGDFVEAGVDCVCPFERPPGGDIDGREGLEEVARALSGRVTMNGNIHTVETLIRGGPADVRREAGEVLEAFAGNPRVILGTGDQVGRETPAENLAAMVEAGRAAGPWPSAAPGGERAARAAAGADGKAG